MGDPGRIRKAYNPPGHPWNKERIETEKEIVREYGLKNKTEVYKVQSFLRKITSQAKKLTALRSTLAPQVKKEEEQLLKRLHNLGLLNADSKLEDVLGLSLRDVLSRRLQTIVYRNNLARTAKQARQFIVHNHVLINGKKMNTPSYLVLRSEENLITFNPASEIAKDDHPERMNAEQIKQKEAKPKEKPREIRREDGRRPRKPLRREKHAKGKERQ